MQNPNDIELKPSDIKKEVDKRKMEGLIKLRHPLTIHTPIAKQVKPDAQHYYLDQMLSDGRVRIETNFKMR